MTVETASTYCELDKAVFFIFHVSSCACADFTSFLLDLPCLAPIMDGWVMNTQSCACLEKSTRWWMVDRPPPYSALYSLPLSTHLNSPLTIPLLVARDILDSLFYSKCSNSTDYACFCEMLTESGRSQRRMAPNPPHGQGTPKARYPSGAISAHLASGSSGQCC